MTCTKLNSKEMQQNYSDEIDTKETFGTLEWHFLGTNHSMLDKDNVNYFGTTATLIENFT